MRLRCPHYVGVAMLYLQNDCCVDGCWWYSKSNQAKGGQHTVSRPAITTTEYYCKPISGGYNVITAALDLLSPNTLPRRSAAAYTRSSAIAEGPRDASCQLKSCQLPRSSAETTYTTSPDQIDGMKLEI